MIIAIDGPAASGKGTLGKRLARHYGYRHLDTGVIYRAVAKTLLDAGADPTDEVLAVSAALALDPEKFGDPELKTQAVGDAASVVSAIPRVREVLLKTSAPAGRSWVTRSLASAPDPATSARMPFDSSAAAVLSMVSSEATTLNSLSVPVSSPLTRLRSPRGGGAREPRPLPLHRWQRRSV